MKNKILRIISGILLIWFSHLSSSWISSLCLNGCRNDSFDAWAASNFYLMIILIILPAVIGIGLIIWNTALIQGYK